jgi:hypothetical protein
MFHAHDLFVCHTVSKLGETPAKTAVSTYRCIAISKKYEIVS